VWDKRFDLSILNMSKRIELSTKQPLRGVRVLVGRAKHQAGALATQLRSLGATALEIPFIEIRRPKSFKPLDAALTNLDSYDWLILTSVNGVDAMWERLDKLGLAITNRGGHEFTRSAKGARKIAATAAEGRLRVAAIGPATKKAIEHRRLKVDVVPEEYIAESVVRALKDKVKGGRILLVRAKVARDVIPRELRKAGAHVDVIEAYETVVPRSSRARLRAVLKNPRRRPHIITFTSSSTARNFVALFGGSETKPKKRTPHPGNKRDSSFEGIRLASIGPVTSSTLRELGLPVDIEASEFTIPGLVKAVRTLTRDSQRRNSR